MDTVKKEEALYDFVAEDGIRHRVWVISQEEQIQTVEDAFASIGEVYIADGHHRAASAVKVGQKRRKERPDYTGEEEFNYFLSVLFPDEELMIMDYNRVVKDLNGMSAEMFLQRMTQLFSVGAPQSQPVKPQKKGNFPCIWQENGIFVQFRRTRYRIIRFRGWMYPYCRNGYCLLF